MSHAYPDRPKQRSSALLATLAGISALCLVPCMSLGADANPFVTINTLTTPDGELIQETIIDGPPTPPPGFAIQRQSVSLPEPNAAAGINTLTVPAFDWVFGCSAVSGAMIAAYYDRSGWPNMYTGPTNGGVMPLDNSGWPRWTDTGGSSYPSCPLIASRNGIDGRVIDGSIDDYWVEYDSVADDPYITGGWAQHDWGSAIGDYMKTSQSAFGNTDGATTFYTWNSLPEPLTCDDMEDNDIDQFDGTYGRKLFYEARGYSVTDCYNQKTDNNGGGFTFAMYQAEIDAGRPVMLNLAGHTIVGTGYDSTTDTVYIHDTWDYSTHTMSWGGIYSGMELLSVSIVNLNPCGPGVALTTSPTPLWQQLAMPCVPSGAATVASTLGNAPTANLSASAYGTQWAMKRRDLGASTDTMLASSSRLAPGVGYWIKSLQAPVGGMLTIEGTATPTQVDIDGCQSSAGCTLVPVYASGQPRGTKLLGNPFPYDIDWSQVRVRENGVSIYTPSEAQEANLLSNQFWVWNGTAYTTASDAIPNRGNLQYARGFWVQVLAGASGSTLELLIPAQASALASPTPGTGEWTVRLEVKNPSNGWQTEAMLGQWSDAETDYDSGDLLAMRPFASPYLSLTFPHTDWGAHQGDYATDLRPAVGAPEQWALNLRGDPRGTQVVLTWEGDPAVLANSQLIDGKAVVDLADYPNGYPLTLSGKVRRLGWQYLGPD